MAIQYRDGSFSRNMPLEEAQEIFEEAIQANTARALFVGTEEELDEIKNQQDLSERVDKLSQAIKDINAKNSEIIAAPTLAEIEKYIGSE